MLRNFFKAGVGSAAAQIINFGTLPLITRMYTPEEYALWAIAIATASIFGSISCLRYELAIVIPEKDDDSSLIFFFCLIFSSLIGIFVFVLLHLPNSLDLVGLEGNNLIIGSIALIVIMMGWNFSFYYWATRKKYFFLGSISQMILAVFTVLSHFGFYFLDYANSKGLLIGSLIGYVSSNLFMFFGIMYLKHYPSVKEFELGHLVKLLKEYKNFALYSTPYSLFGEVRSRLSIYVFEKFLSKVDVGLYAFSFRLMNAPVSLVSGALRPVLFQKVAENGVGSVENLINKILSFLVLVVTPLLIFYFYFAEELFQFLFGNKWAVAGEYGRYLILPVFTFLLCNWMDRIMDVLGKQKLVLILEIVFSVLSIVALIWGFSFNYGVETALLAQSIVLVIYNLLYLFLVYETAGYQKTSLIYLILKFFIVSLITILIIILLKDFLSMVFVLSLIMVCILMITTIILRRGALWK